MEKLPVEEQKRLLVGPTAPVTITTSKATGNIRKNMDITFCSLQYLT